jgi:hypothetical protein
MRQVEIKNKLPASARNAEDVLTSNVFSLFKYSDRRTCLRQLLRLVGLEIPAAEFDQVPFAFWPRYDDGRPPLGSNPLEHIP